MSCGTELAMTPLRDRPLAEQLALQGGLELQPTPRRARRARVRAALLWAAFFGGLVISALAL